MPSVRSVQPKACGVAIELVKLQGSQKTLLGPSTFHLFWDLFGVLRSKRITIYCLNSLAVDGLQHAINPSIKAPALLLLQFDHHTHVDLRGSYQGRPGAHGLYHPVGQRDARVGRPQVSGGPAVSQFAGFLSVLWGH